MTNSPDYQRTRREQRRARGVCIDCPRHSERYQRCAVCRAKVAVGSVKEPAQPMPSSQAA